MSIDYFGCIHTGGMTYRSASGLHCSDCGQEICTNNEESEWNTTYALEEATEDLMIEDIHANDWMQISQRLGILRDRLQDGTRCVLAGSDCLTVEIVVWVAVVNELRRIQKQCTAYGEMHCPRVPERPGNQQPGKAEEAGI